MGLYNMVFGSDSHAAGYLSLLKSTDPGVDFGRLRDAWCQRVDDKIFIRVHTRNGGGNRESYEAEIQSMQAHPWYTHDHDDSFDSTYADFYFLVPSDYDAELYERLKELAVEPVDMGEKWKQVIDSLR